MTCGASLPRLKITGDLERIGDYAANVAKRSIVLGQYSLPYSLAGLAHMARMVQEQLKSIIDALGRTTVTRPSRYGGRTARSTTCTTRCSAS